MASCPLLGTWFPGWAVPSLGLSPSASAEAQQTEQEPLPEPGFCQQFNHDSLWESEA